MGTCPYCKKSAGLFASQHSECAEKHDRGLQLATRLALEGFSGQLAPAKFLERLRTLRSEFYLSGEEASATVAKTFVAVVDRCLEDGVLSEEEDSTIDGILKAIELQPEQLDESAGFRFSNARFLRCLLLLGPEANDKMFRALARLPFELAASEKVAFAADHVEYLKAKTRREYVGGSTGVSFRVAKGLYIRQSAFRGHPVERTEFPVVDKGKLAITTEAIYFAGQHERFRLPYDKILSREPRTDGLLFWRTRANAKAEGFRKQDGLGWLLTNIIENLNREADVGPGPLRLIPGGKGDE